MAYTVKEIFYTLQGEGAQAGRPAVFCRFAGCNLWSGKEKDRPTADCQFCDTEFLGTDGPGGGKFATAEQLAQAVAGLWPLGHSGKAKPYVVCTGGEPLLQLDEALILALQRHGFEVAVETNGTQAAPPGLDWICVSPKSTSLVLDSGDELKLVFPQTAAPPEAFAQLAFKHYYLQPMDGPQRSENTALAVSYCLQHPQWRLGLQLHKLLGIP